MINSVCVHCHARDESWSWEIADDERWYAHGKLWCILDATTDLVTVEEVLLLDVDGAPHPRCPYKLEHAVAETQ